ncbi:hypothetical protein FIBSPDRAFT_96722 [Athelia psychrophila]|uniref:Uncharacterized protein n=1 Tax=Athelia psychrophila TaxID=1759441 RepID=A0A166DUE4_9AGAM|nr:hypothetical protein FIBSPDRAFT_96722 [Fibularhizoctonia sp. CBS 109695]
MYSFNVISELSHSAIFSQLQDLQPVIRGCQNGGAIVSDCNPAHYCWERFSGSCSDATSRQQVFESPMQQL